MPCTLEFPKAYPLGRPAFFAQRFMAYVLRRGLAFEVGADAIVLLLAVVSAEDRTRYSKPVGFWNDHLMSLTGMSRNRLFAARQKLIDRGWLVYFAGARGRAPLYFVAVPGESDAAVNATALGESNADELMMEAGRADEGGGTREESQSWEAGHQLSAVSPQPSAIDPQPSTLNAQPSTPGSDLSALVSRPDDTLTRQRIQEALQRLKVESPDCLERAERVASLAEIEAVVQWAESRAIEMDGRTLRPWKPGAIYHRLVTRGTPGRAADEGWVAVDDEWARAWERAELDRKRREEAERARLEAEKKQAEEDLKRRGAEQLEFSWGGVVDRVASSEDGCERLFALLRERSEVLERWARAKARGGADVWHSPTVRPVLLRAAEQGLIG